MDSQAPESPTKSVGTGFSRSTGARIRTKPHATCACTNRSASPVFLGTLSHQLLRRHVHQCSGIELRGQARHGIAADARNPKIGDFDGAFLAEQDVGGLEIPVDDLFFVGVFQSGTNCAPNPAALGLAAGLKETRHLKERFHGRQAGVARRGRVAESFLQIGVALLACSPRAAGSIRCWACAANEVAGKALQCRQRNEPHGKDPKGPMRLFARGEPALWERRPRSNAV